MFKHLRVPLLLHLVLAFLPVLLSMPLPQYEVFLYSLILSISVAVQDFRSRPSIISVFGLGMCLFRIQRCNVRRSTPVVLAASETVYVFIFDMPQCGICQGQNSLVSTQLSAQPKPRKEYRTRRGERKKLTCVDRACGHACFRMGDSRAGNLYLGQEAKWIAMKLWKQVRIAAGVSPA